MKHIRIFVLVKDSLYSVEDFKQSGLSAYEVVINRWQDIEFIVSGRKHSKFKINSFEFISLFFLSADTSASPKERKAK